MIQFPQKRVILVTGANGQLGREFRIAAKDQDKFEFVLATRDNLDITNEQEVLHVFSKFRPDICINCAAYTKVDAAEKNREEAFLINEKAVSHLINACAQYPALLVHFSTDYVYHSITDRLIREEDACQPAGVYAQSKRAGEVLLENSQIKWLCLRVSWLYSSYGHNFVKTILRLTQELPVVDIVSDQYGSPTYARDLAGAILQIVDHKDQKSYNQFYNYCNTGTTNWADFARRIIEMSGTVSSVTNISTEQFGAAAPRPHWSALDVSKVSATFSLEIYKWEDSLKNCLELLSK